MKDFRKFLGKAIPNLYVQHGSHSQPPKKTIPNLYIQHGSHAQEENNFPDVYIQQGSHSLLRKIKNKIFKEDENLHGWEPEKDLDTDFKSELDSTKHNDFGTGAHVTVDKPTDSDHMKKYKSNFYYDNYKSKESVDKAINHGNKYDIENAMASPHITPEHINKVLDRTDIGAYPKSLAIKHPNATSENISKALDQVKHLDKYDSDRSYIQNSATMHPNLTTDHIKGMIRNKHTDSDILSNLIAHPKTTNDDVTKILNHTNGQGSWMFNQAINHNKLSSDHIDSIVKNHSDPAKQTKLIEAGAKLAPHQVEELQKTTNHYVKQSLIGSQYGNADMVSDIIKNPESSQSNINFALGTRHANKDHFEHVLNNLSHKNSSAVVNRVFNSGYVTKDHVDKIMSGHDDFLKEKLLDGDTKASNHVSHDHIDDILDNSSNSYLKSKAIESPHATEKHFEKALHSDPDNLYALLHNSKVGSQHADLFFKHKDTIGTQSVYDKFSQFNDLKQEHFDEIVKHGGSKSSSMALQNNPEKASVEHLNHVLDPKNKHDLAQNALTHHVLSKFATPEHTDMALAHPNWYVKETALSYGKLSQKHEDDAFAKIKDDSGDAHKVLSNENVSSDFINKAANQDENKGLKNAAQGKLFYVHDNKHIGESVEDVNKHLWDRQDLSKLSQEQRKEVRRYTGGSSGLNGELIRADGKEEDIEHPYNEKAKNLDGALSHHPMPKMSLYSGLGFNPTEKTDGHGVFRSTAFLSSSTNPHTAKGFTREDSNGDKHILKINVPEGHKALFVGNETELTSHHEHEVILPRNHTFKINLNPIRTLGDRHGKTHMYDTHIVPHDVEDPHSWEPPKEDK